MADCMGKEAEMTEEIRLKLPKVKGVKDDWNSLRDSGPVFTGERDRWGFCISKVLYPDSLFLLGLNPSEPKGDTRECFSLDDLKAYKKIFDPLRHIAAELPLKYSYFDLFCVRRTKPEELLNKLWQLLGRKEGRDLVLKMLNLPTQAIMKAQPKAIYVCNGTVRNAFLKSGPLAKFLKEAGVPTSSLLNCREPHEHFCMAGGKKWYFYYTVTDLGDKPVPVLLGIDVGNQKVTDGVRNELIKHIITTFNVALQRGAENFYNTLAKAE